MYNYLEYYYNANVNEKDLLNIKLLYYDLKKKHNNNARWWFSMYVYYSA